MSQIKLMSRAGRVVSGATAELGETLAVQSQARHTPIRTMCCSNEKTLTMETLNPKIIKLQYAVRGPLVARAAVIKKELEKGAKKPFKTVINANLGDAHAMQQIPITFIRQVIACAVYPDLIKTADFPDDVKERAQSILKACAGQKSVGAYTSSYGMDMIRNHVAEYIECRDGHPAKWENVVLCAGASSGIKHCLELFCNKVDGKDTGVLIPIPQYPLYSATLAEYGLGQVGYYLDENNGWVLDVAELERAMCDASDKYAVRALVAINPGNPTGQVLKRENIEKIIKFAKENSLMIFADEVYQDNVYAKGSKFYSFKKVMTEMGAPYNTVELASFMSISKGYMGECGLRGGWMELCNLDPDVQANLYKAISAMLCPSTIGQIVVDCIARTPAPGDPSYEQWECEKSNTLDSLAKRAKMIVETFNKMEGFKCNVVQGAMYAFPRIQLPKRAVEEAKKAGVPADGFYAKRLLEDTGICIIPGSGFGQSPGTYHFRTTILPQPKLLKEMLVIFQAFHQKFTKEYA
ncbi:alanine aminotransferase 1-like [Helicoverpa zea]|uniref:alanine aminotransferase 1-like n=1 Tax=Helicoverpa zea TaxID=7113 RepID=UPI001F590BD5|nr:alanine aminotransferase 1-like [Helicoverpa zea]